MTNLLPGFWSETLKRYSVVQTTAAVERQSCVLQCVVLWTAFSWINQGCMLRKVKGCVGEGFQQSMADGGREA